MYFANEERKQVLVEKEYCSLCAGLDMLVSLVGEATVCL